MWKRMTGLWLEAPVYTGYLGARMRSRSWFKIRHQYFDIVLEICCGPED